MIVDERALCECNSDLDSNASINSNDAILFKSLIEYTSSNSQKNFNDFFSDLVDGGIVPNIDLSNLDDSVYNSKRQCFDFSFNSEQIDNIDVEILDGFSSYLSSVNKTTINLTDANNFKLFLDSLKIQGILTDVDTDLNIMIPTISSESKIYFTDESWILKICTGEVGYDESVSEMGSLIDSSGNLFLVADPGVRTYYDWNGESSPRSWKSTGLCKVFKRKNDELSEEYAIIHPPVDIIKNKTLPSSDLIPMGTPASFNGKTIAIDGDYVAVSWHYSDKGVVYIYKDDGVGNYTNIHEITIEGNFSNGLPVLEFNNSMLFVSNPQEQSSAKVNVYNVANFSNYEVTDALQIILPPEEIKKIGFGSCMKTNETSTMLFVGHPMHHKNVNWDIDQYTTTLVDLFIGAVFVYKLEASVWTYSEIIYPNTDDYELVAVPEDMDLQFGYSIDYSNSNLFVGSPRSFTTRADRREGAVFAYNYSSVLSLSLLETNSLISSEFILYDKIMYSDANFDTVAIDSGLWNFGLAIAVNSSANKIYIVHQIPEIGTFVSYYTKQSSVFDIGEEFFYKVSSDIIVGSVKLSSDDSTTVFGADKLLRLLL